MFKNVDHALQWASNIANLAIYRQPKANYLASQPNPSTTNDLLMGLSQEQAHMQAYHILNMVRNLSDPIHLQFVGLKYGLTSDSDLLEANSGIDRPSLKLIHQYMGIAFFNQRELRKDLKCQMCDVFKYRIKVYRSLDRIKDGAFGILQIRMIEAGLINH